MLNTRDDDMLIFLGETYSYGLPFKITMHEGKTRIVSGDGKFLTVKIPADLVKYAEEECRQHTASTRCSRCDRTYTIGFVSEPRDCITLVPHGLPSMFVFYDGVFYYPFDVLKASYADLRRVERIEDASLFQFVSVLS